MKNFTSCCKNSTKKFFYYDLQTAHLFTLSGNKKEEAGAAASFNYSLEMELSR